MFISFKTSQAPANQTTKTEGAIDWGDFDVIGQSVNLEASKSGDEYGFEVIDDGKIHAEESEITTKDTLLSCFDTRNQILANLEEVNFPL